MTLEYKGFVLKQYSDNKVSLYKDGELLMSKSVNKNYSLKEAHEEVDRFIESTKSDIIIRSKKIS